MHSIQLESCNTCHGTMDPCRTLRKYVDVCVAAVPFLPILVLHYSPYIITIHASTPVRSSRCCTESQYQGRLCGEADWIQGFTRRSNHVLRLHQCTMRAEHAQSSCMTPTWFLRLTACHPRYADSRQMMSCRAIPSGFRILDPCTVRLERQEHVHNRSDLTSAS